MSGGFGLLCIFLIRKQAFNGLLKIIDVKKKLCIRIFYSLDLFVKIANKLFICAFKLLIINQDQEIETNQ